MQGKPDFSSMKVKLSNRLGTRDEQGSSSRTLHRMENRRYEAGAGAGEAEQCKGNGRFFWYLFFWLPRIMGCVGPINASQTSVMNDLMFLFVIHWESERERESCDLRPQQTAQSNQIKRGEKITDNSFDFTFLLPFLLCVSSTDQTSWHRVNGNNRSL